MHINLTDIKVEDLAEVLRKAEQKQKHRGSAPPSKIRIHLQSLDAHIDYIINTVAKLQSLEERGYKVSCWELVEEKLKLLEPHRLGELARMRNKAS